MIADIEHDTRQRQGDNGDARNRHPDRKQSSGQCRLRNLDGGIGNDRHRAHRGEVVANNRQRQQQGSADLPFLFLAVKTDGKGDRANCRAKHDRYEDKHGIPQDGALDFECGHPGVVHRCDAPANDGAAQPRRVAPVRRQRHRKPCAGQQDRRQQRQYG